ncbi:MAG: T9SS type A sorting domain-containing protein [Flavobacteriales bacterium]|nr:T9SS type A sorting domain-containing protein [Flavobacteriales bacterium]
MRRERIPAPAVLDDNEHPLTIPSFTYNGVAYTDALVGDNGALIFGVTAGAVNNGNLALPATFGASPVGLAVFWDDLDNLSTTQIYTQQVGNLFIIQWHEWGHFSATVEGLIITFQVQLDLSSGKIYYAYQDVNCGGAQSANDAGASATIGLGYSLTEATQVSFNTASLTDGQVISFTPNSNDAVWSPGTYLSANNITNPVFGPAPSGTYPLTVVVTNPANNCTATGNITINANPALSAGQANITPSVASVCGTTPVLLTANPTGGGGPYSYAWTDPNANAAGTNQTQNAAIAGVWSVLITDACGGQATATKTVAVFPVPTASASAGPGCVGNALQLNGSSDLGTTFNWSGPDSFSSTDQNPQIAGATAANSGTYTLTASANGCTSANATVAVTVNPLPAITSLTATPAAICAGSNSQLNVTASVTLPNVLITEVTLWGASGVALGQTPVYPAYIPTTPDDYVELNNASTVPADVSGWTFSDHLSNNAANNHPALTFPPGTIIPANGVLVIGLGLGTQSPANLYFITGGSSNILSSGGSYCFILRNGSGTIIDAVATNTGVFAPALGVTPADWSGAGASSLSSNAGTVRTATNDSNTGADWTTSTVAPQSIGYYNPGYNNPNSGTVTAWAWTPATFLSSTTIANPVATATATTAYTVTVTDSNGCENSGSLTLTVNPIPTVSAGSYGPFCVLDAPVALAGTPSGGTFSGTGVSGPVGSQVFDPGVGTQTITYTYSDGTCPNSDVTTITVDDTDTDGDGIADCGDSCPTVFGEVGDFCDSDPGDGVSPGALDATCTCVAIPCTENISVELRTDVNSDEASFEILVEGSSTVFCNGGINPAFPTGITSPIVLDCCLPEGCYKLNVYDSGGDGFVSGGYQVRESGTGGRRIIDNFDNFSNGSLSSIAGPQSFCLPIGDIDLINHSCDKLDWVQYRYLVSHADPLVAAEWVPNGANSVQDANSGYEFWIFDPNGTYSFRRFHAHNVSDGFSPASANRAARLKIHGWFNTVLTPHIPEGVLMNVRVRGRVNGLNQAFGPACRMKMDAARAACPLVWLQDDNTNTSDYSCGVTRTFGGTNTNANKIVAKPPQFEPPPLAGGTGVRFQFRFRIPGESVCIVLPPQTSPTRYLNWNSAFGAPLECSKTYEVDVRVSKDGGATWCVDSPSPACYPAPIVEWGRMCTVTIDCQTAQGGASSMGTQNGGALTMYPNPNRGDLVTIALSEVAADVNTVSVDIYDLRGQRVTARTIAVQDGYLNTVIDLQGDLAGGMYMVNITAGDKTYTERLVIQP